MLLLLLLLLLLRQRQRLLILLLLLRLRLLLLLLLRLLLLLLRLLLRRLLLLRLLLLLLFVAHFLHHRLLFPTVRSCRPRLFPLWLASTAGLLALGRVLVARTTTSGFPFFGRVDVGSQIPSNKETNMRGCTFTDCIVANG